MPRIKLTQGIYKITNLVNNKVYIGQSSRLESRLDYHKSSLKGNYHYNYNLQNDYNLYGVDNFKFDILESCTVDELEDRERYWIEYYKSTNADCGYNVESGGNLNKVLPEAVKEKISLSKKGVSNGPHSEETKRKISEKNKGNTAWLGRTHSEETKRKMSESKRYEPTQEMIDDIKAGISNKEFLNKYQTDTFKGQRMWNRLRKELCVKHKAPNVK